MCYFEGDYRGVEAFSIVEEPIFDSCNLSYFLKTLDQGSIRVSRQHGIAHVQIDVSSNEFHPTGIPPMAPGNGNLTDILPNPRTSSIIATNLEQLAKNTVDPIESLSKRFRETDMDRHREPESVMHSAIIAKVQMANAEGLLSLLSWNFNT